MPQYAKIGNRNSKVIKSKQVSLSYFVLPQGDEMKKIGIQPIPMMDRDKKDEVPQGQVRPALLLMCL